MSRNAELTGFLPQFDVEAAVAQHFQVIEIIPSLSERVRAAAELVYFKQFGLWDSDDLGQIINNAVDSAIEYFYAPKFPADKLGEAWFKALSPSLVLALLSDRDDAIAKLCSWFRLDLTPEYCGGLEYQIPQIYLLMTNALRPDPQAGTEELEASIGQCRAKRVKLLLKAWQAACDGSQEELNKAIRDSVKHFAARKKPNLDATYPGEWIARSQTALCLTAMRMGKDFPDLPEELAALLVSRRSLGLEPAGE